MASATDLSHLPQRGVARVVPAQPVRYTPDHTAKTVIPPGQWKQYDPFLLTMDGATSHSDNKGNS